MAVAVCWGYPRCSNARDAGSVCGSCAKRECGSAGAAQRTCCCVMMTPHRHDGHGLVYFFCGGLSSSFCFTRSCASPLLHVKQDHTPRWGVIPPARLRSVVHCDELCGGCRERSSPCKWVSVAIKSAPSFGSNSAQNMGSVRAGSSRITRCRVTIERTFSFTRPMTSTTSRARFCWISSLE